MNGKIFLQVVLKQNIKDCYVDKELFVINLSKLKGRTILKLIASQYECQTDE